MESHEHESQEASSFSLENEILVLGEKKATSPPPPNRIDQKLSDHVLLSNNSVSISFENVRLKEKVAALSAELVTVKAKCSALQLDNSRLKLALSAASSLRTQVGRSRSNTGGSPTSSVGCKDSSTTSQISASVSSVALQQLASTNSFYTKTAHGTTEGGGNGGLPRPPSSSSFLFGLGRERSETRDRSDTTESLSVSGSYRDRGNTCESEKLSVGNADLSRGRASSTGWEASFNHPSLSPSSSFTPPSGSPEPPLVATSAVASAVTEKQAPPTSAVSTASSMLRMPSISFSKMWVPSRSSAADVIKESNTKTVSFDAEKDMIKDDTPPHQVVTGQSLERIDSDIEATDASTARVVDLDNSGSSLLDLTAQNDAVESQSGLEEATDSSSVALANPSPPSHKVTMSSFISGENCSAAESNTVSTASNASSASSSFSFRFFGTSGSVPPPPPPPPSISNLTVDIGSASNSVKQSDTISSSWGLFGGSTRSTPSHSADANNTTSSSSSSAQVSTHLLSSSTSASSSSSLWSTLLSSVSLTRRQRFPVNDALLKLPSWSRKRSSSLVSFSKGIGDDRLSLARSLFLLQDDHECATVAGNACKLVLVHAGDQIPPCAGFGVLRGSVVQVASFSEDRSDQLHDTTCNVRFSAGNIVPTRTDRFLATSDSLCRVVQSRKHRALNTLSVSRARALGSEAPRHDPANILLKVNKAISTATTIDLYLAALRRFSELLNAIPLPKQITSETESSALRQSVSDFSRELGAYLNGVFFPLGSLASFSSFVDALGASILIDKKETPSFRAFMRQVLIASSRTITGGDSLRLVQENLSSKNCLTFLAAEAGGPAEFITTGRPEEDGEEKDEDRFWVHLSANNNFRVIADAVSEDKASPGSQTSGILALLRCTLSEELVIKKVQEEEEEEEEKEEKKDSLSLSLLDRLLTSSDQVCETSTKARTINVDFVFV